MKMQIGEKMPENVRALRMLTEELARPISKNAPNLISMDDLMQVLAET